MLTLKTYDQFLAEAKAISLVMGYGAVTEVVNYRTGKSRITTAGGRTLIKTESRGCEFRGVVAQFCNGQPCSK
jgi:hypothetical protein